MTHDEILQVVQAHKQGHKIEYRELYLREHGHWIPADTPDLWDFRNRRYRVSDEPIKPREWIIVLCQGQVVGPSIFIGGDLRSESVRVREVIE